MKTLLIPYDFSTYAEQALQFALGLSKQTGGEVHLLHVIEPLGNESFDAFGDGYGSGKMDDVFMLKLIEKSKKDLLKVKEKYKADGLHVHMRMGASIHQTIVEYASTLKADVIVMGTLGHGTIDNQLVGSNTQKVTRTAPCPVISVSDETDTSIRNLIFASDFEQVDAGVMARIKDYQKALGAELHLLRVCTPTNFENSQVLHEKMEEVISNNKLDGASIHTFNDFFIEDGILNFASSFDNALICLTTEGRTGFARLLTHSIAEDVVNYARRPVLTINTKTVK